MLDVLLKNGTILDGSGAPRYRADVAIKDGIILSIAPRITESAKEVIDAEGLFVTPGFIDTHAHSDDNVFFKNDGYNCLEQGITLQLAGNCGESPAPYPENAVMNPIHREVSPEEMERVIRIAKSSHTFMEEAKHKEMGINMAFLVGHNALRVHAMGFSDAEPTASQMADMKENVAKAMEAGFFGFSTGLVYAPSVYGTTKELVELAKVVAQYKGVYASHIRGEGNHVMGAVGEAIQVGRESGSSVLISHIKIAGSKNRGKAKDILAMIHRANAEGIHVFADQYPYDAGSAPLISQIPPKYLTDGKNQVLQKLHDSDFRKQVEYSIFNETEEFESILYHSGFGGATIADAAATPQYVGLSLEQIAKTEDKAPIDAMADLLIANNGVVQGIYTCQSMEDVLTFMADPYVYAGCDWFSYPVHYDPAQRSGGHPRGTSTMCRRIELIRNYGLRTAEECIRSMTGGPAQALGMKNRGLVKEGYAADICVLDYRNVRATSDYLYPFRKNEGISYVLVNGQIAVRNGESLGSYFGQVVCHDYK